MSGTVNKIKELDLCFGADQGRELTNGWKTLCSSRTEEKHLCPSPQSSCTWQESSCAQEAPPEEMFQVWTNWTVVRRHEKTQDVLIPRLSTLLMLCFKAFFIYKLQWFCLPSSAELQNFCKIFLTSQPQPVPAMAALTQVSFTADYRIILLALPLLTDVFV